MSIGQEELARLTQALAEVAVLLKTPKNVPSRLFDVGKAIVQLALTGRFSPTSVEVRQLELSSSADRRHSAVATISTWARQVCCRQRDRHQAILGLLNNARAANPATKRALLQRFGLGGADPGSICRGLSIVLSAIVEQLSCEMDGVGDDEDGDDEVGGRCPSPEPPRINNAAELSRTEERRSTALTDLAKAIVEQRRCYKNHAKTVNAQPQAILQQQWDLKMAVERFRSELVKLRTYNMEGEEERTRLEAPLRRVTADNSEDAIPEADVERKIAAAVHHAHAAANMQQVVGNSSEFRHEGSRTNSIDDDGDIDDDQLDRGPQTAAKPSWTDDGPGEQEKRLSGPILRNWGLPAVGDDSSVDPGDRRKISPGSGLMPETVAVKAKAKAMVELFRRDVASSPRPKRSTGESGAEQSRSAAPAGPNGRRRVGGATAAGGGARGNGRRIGEVTAAGKVAVGRAGVESGGPGSTTTTASATEERQNRPAGRHAAPEPRPQHFAGGPSSSIGVRARGGGVAPKAGLLGKACGIAQRLSMSPRAQPKEESRRLHAHIRAKSGADTAGDADSDVEASGAAMRDAASDENVGSLVSDGEGVDAAGEWSEGFSPKEGQGPHCDSRGTAEPQLSGAEKPVREKGIESASDSDGGAAEEEDESMAAAARGPTVLDDCALAPEADSGGISEAAGGAEEDLSTFGE